MKRFKLDNETRKKILKLAKIHISRFGNFEKFLNPIVKNIYPIREAGGEFGNIFEVTFTDKNNSEKGYVLISLSPKYPPIIKFSFKGPGHVESLTKTVRNTNFYPVFYTPFYFVAEDEEGNLIAEFGEKPTIFEKRPSSRKKLKFSEYKRCFPKTRDSFVAKMKKPTLSAWQKILKNRNKDIKDASDDDYIEPSDIPDNNYQVLTAHHYEALARYTQIAPNTGANNHDFHSGCTSCAWMCLIGYHDNISTPDILRGTHYTRGGANSYQSRVMMALSEHLGTHKARDGDGGSVDPDNIKKGYSFITNVLGHTIKNKDFTEEGEMEAFQVVYDNLGMYGVPSVISIPGHTLIAYEVWANMDDLSEDHYLKVYQGWGTLDPNADPFIPFELIDDGAWTLEQINTNNEVELNYNSIAIPDAIEIGVPGNDNELVIGIRLENEDIGILYSSDGKTFNLKYQIEASGKNPPSMAIEGFRIDPFVAWTESDGKLRLIQIYPKQDRIEERPVPEDGNGNPGLGNSYIGSVIEILNGKLFYIWHNNIVYTPLENFERSGRPWPIAFGFNSHNNSFFGSLGIYLPIRPPCFKTDGNILYLAFTMQRGWYQQTEMYLLSDDPDVGIKFLTDTSNNHIFPSKERLCCFNETIYATTSGPITEISFNRYNYLGQYYEPQLEDVHWPYYIYSNKAFLGSFGNHEIGPCLFSGWLDETGNIHIRYHSVDTNGNPLDYTGWPHF